MLFNCQLSRCHIGRFISTEMLKDSSEMHQWTLLENLCHVVKFQQFVRLVLSSHNNDEKEFHVILCCLCFINLQKRFIPNMYYSRPFCRTLELELQTLMSAGNKIAWRFIYLAAKLLFTLNIFFLLQCFYTICCNMLYINPFEWGQRPHNITYSLLFLSSLNIFSLVSGVAGHLIS